MMNGNENKTPRQSSAKKPTASAQGSRVTRPRTAASITSPQYHSASKVTKGSDDAVRPQATSAAKSTKNSGGTARPRTAATSTSATRVTPQSSAPAQPRAQKQTRQQARKVTVQGQAHPHPRKATAQAQAHPKARKASTQMHPHIRKATTQTQARKTTARAQAHPQTRKAAAQMQRTSTQARRPTTGHAPANRAGVAPARRTPSTAKSHQPGNPRTPLIAAVVALVVLGAIALGIGYQFFWRNIDITVNGEPVSVHIGTDAATLLEDNDYFGAKPGRLLSVSGKELDKDGGDRCTLEVNGEGVASKDFASLEIKEGSTLSVKDGGDTTEEHTEKTVELAPELTTEGTGAIQFVSQWGKSGKKTVWTGKQSGETVDKEVVEEPTDMVVSYLNPNPQDGKKYIALTFDDGPSSYTSEILAILKEYGVKATFFNLGTNVNSMSATVVADGHEMASHTNSHANLPECDRDTLRSEISTAFDSIEEASGERVQMIRAPYGAFTTVEWARAADLISCNVLWNIDTLDWELPGADAITDTVLSQAFNGAIALMHDGGGDRSQDIEALPDIIEGLQDAGYELVTVSELMELDGRFPEDVINGTVKMPKSAVLPEA